MEQPMRCKTLTAIYKNEINTLKKLYEIDFLIHKSVRIHIEQFTVRKIEIDFTSEQLVDDLIAVLTKVERLSHYRLEIARHCRRAIFLLVLCGKAL